MAKLIHAINSYYEFERSTYFIICFDQIASTMYFDTTLAADKENMEAALETIDLQSQDLEVDLKHWHTENAKDADFSKDFPYEYLLKSKSKKLMVWILLNCEELKVEFLYDHLDLKLEQWVISTHHTLGTKFGYNRTPVFKVLSRDGSSYYTEEVRTEGFESDIKKM